ncbi:MAG: lytic transglycosylase domain-containing protein [Ruminococcus sp.]|nr:lytic transglycosylase domain-containing protein [Ruminococcus sp.]
MTTARHSRRKSKGFRRFLRFIYFILAMTVSALLIWGAIQLLSDTKEKTLNSLYPVKYEEYVNKAARDYNMDKALIYGVIRTESGFNPEAESSAGARGLMQIMPESFQWLQTIRGVEGEYTDDDLYDPEINIDYGVYLLKYFYDRYGTEQTAVAAYNAGFVVGDWLSNPDYSTDGVVLDYIPYPETSAYVDKVLSAKDKYKELYFN